MYVQCHHKTKLLDVITHQCPKLETVFGVTGITSELHIHAPIADKYICEKVPRYNMCYMPHLGLRAVASLVNIMVGQRFGRNLFHEIMIFNAGLFFKTYWEQTYALFGS